jgi:hypothetical protein
MILTLTNINQVSIDCSTVPRVNINPPNVDCVGLPGPGQTCTQTYDFDTVVTLTAITTCGQVCWSGACAAASGSVCTLKMNADQTAGARFTFGACITSEGRPVGLAWNIALDSPGAIGQAVVDGSVVVAESGRQAQALARVRDGEAIVAATLVRGTGNAGTWRFEAQDGEAIAPGSLRVLRGEVALLTPTSVVFRVKGVSGEQVAFSYRLRR